MACAKPGSKTSSASPSTNITPLAKSSSDLVAVKYRSMSSSSSLFTGSSAREKARERPLGSLQMRTTERRGAMVAKVGEWLVTIKD